MTYAIVRVAQNWGTGDDVVEIGPEECGGTQRTSHLGRRGAPSPQRWLGGAPDWLGGSAGMHPRVRPGGRAV